MIFIVRSGSRHNLLRPARSTGNLIDISSPPSSNDDRDDIKISSRRHNSPSMESEKICDTDDHNLGGTRKFYPSNRSSKSYTSTVSSKIKKQNLHTGSSTTALGNNISAPNLMSINRFVEHFLRELLFLHMTIYKVINCNHNNFKLGMVLALSSPMDVAVVVRVGFLL